MSIASTQNLQRQDVIEAYKILQGTQKELAQINQNFDISAIERTDKKDEIINNANQQVSQMFGESIANDFVNQAIQQPRPRLLIN